MAINESPQQCASLPKGMSETPNVKPSETHTVIEAYSI
jgi:hypothetical protein